jgi:hypothetical protein
MSFADLIRAAAIRAAERVKWQAEADGDVEGASLAYERLARFEPEIGGTLQCPSCRIQYGGQAPLVAIPAVSPAPTVRAFWKRLNKITTNTAEIAPISIYARAVQSLVAQSVGWSRGATTL